MIELNSSEIHGDLSMDARLYIADLTLAWAGLDSALTLFMIKCFGLSYDAGSILLGNMDSKTKIDRLIVLHKHVGMSNAADGLSSIRKDHKEYADIRNIVMHRRCNGVLIEDEAKVVFSSIKHVMNKMGRIEVAIVDISDIKRATDFASHVDRMVMKLAREMSKPITSLIPTSFPAGDEANDDASPPA